MGWMGTLLEWANAKLLQFLHSIYLYLLKKAGEAWADDDWAPLVHVGLTVFAVVLILYSCCCGGGTMKAPGRRGARISRSGFESNPRGYFKNLRSKNE